MGTIETTVGGLAQYCVTVARAWAEITLPNAVRYALRGLPAFVTG